jgi:hypothetical protein
MNAYQHDGLGSELATEASCMSPACLPPACVPLASFFEDLPPTAAVMSPHTPEQHM